MEVRRVPNNFLAVLTFVLFELDKFTRQPINNRSSQLIIIKLFVPLLRAVFYTRQLLCYSGILLRHTLLFSPANLRPQLLDLGIIAKVLARVQLELLSRVNTAFTVRLF